MRRTEAKMVAALLAALAMAASLSAMARVHPALPGAHAAATAR
jgi:hypothetical protein